MISWKILSNEKKKQTRTDCMWLLSYSLSTRTYAIMPKEMKGIDLRKLAQNFAKEKSTEDRYWQRNDAKFRAVHQRCSTYDEFRQIVEAAHLRPLDRNETLTLERRPISWNQPATKDSQSTTSHLPTSSNNIPQIQNLSLPKNLTEFLQQWRRIPFDMKLVYLHRMTRFDQLFSSDIPTDFLHDLSQLYQTNCSIDDAEFIVNILIDLIQSKRFELMKSFLTKENLIELEQLFARLCSHVHLRYFILLIKPVYLC